MLRLFKWINLQSRNRVAPSVANEGSDYGLAAEKKELPAGAGYSNAALLWIERFCFPVFSYINEKKKKKEGREFLSVSFFALVIVPVYKN